MSTPLEYFQYKKNALHCEGVPLEQLAKKYGTPLYVYSSEAFLNPIRSLEKELKNIPHQICFATKANSNIEVLKLISKLGAGADVVSEGELRRARAAKIPSNRIVFSGVGKTKSEIEYGIREEIYSFNVESVEELKKIDVLASAARKKVRVALRFNPNVNAKTHPYISTGLRENKFGLDENEIHEIFRSRNSFKSIHIVGLSIHIGSQITSLSPLDEAFQILKRTAQDLEKTFRMKFEFLDLGGGLGVTYSNEKPPTIAQYGALIRKHFEKTSYRIILEPGRTIAANAGVLLTEVLYRKNRKLGNFLILDAGMNDLMRPALYGSHHEIAPVDQIFLAGPKQNTHFVGPVCESSDFFAKSRKFSSAVSAGDFLAILSAGAYGMSMASNYNTRLKPAEILVNGTKEKCILKREKYSDLF